MSQSDAVAFLERAETDEAFAADVEKAQGNQQAVLAKVKEAGYDVSEEEIYEAFTDRYGLELTPEQLDQVAAGTDPGLIAGATVGAVVVGVSVVLLMAMNLDPTTDTTGPRMPLHPQTRHGRNLCERSRPTSPKQSGWQGIRSRISTPRFPGVTGRRCCGRYCSSPTITATTLDS